MRLIIAIAFFGASLLLVLTKTGDVLSAWTLWSSPEKIVFEDGDTKLALLWAVILAAAISFFVWPESFQPQPQISMKQVIIMGIGVSGILAGMQALTGGDYLGAAEGHGLANGYIRCGDGDHVMLGELVMAKSQELCGS